MRRVTGTAWLGAALVLSACGSTVAGGGLAPSGTLTSGLDAPADRLGAPSATAPGGPDAPVVGPGGGPRPAGGPDERADRRTTSSAAPGPVTVPEGPTSAAGGARVPGLTATTLTVGVVAADPQANTTLEDAGFGAASLGDEPASWRAMADEVNARGGVAGRRLVLVFHLVNLTDPPASQGQAACDRFTQDTPVAAVVSGYFYASAHECLAQRGVPSILGTNYGVDAVLARRSQQVVAWATPLLDRIVDAVPGAFQRLGHLRRGTTVGLFVVDAPPYRRSADALGAALRALGLTVVVATVRDSESGDYGTAARDASSAVLRFRTEGVTETLFLSRNAFEPTLFMQAASSQGYQPRYLLTSQQYPGGLVGLVPPDQLEGAVALGWAPPADLVADAATSPRARDCVKRLAARGRSYESAAQLSVGLLACDGLDLLDRAAELPGGVSSRSALQRNAVDPATRFVSAFALRTAFDGGRRDGVADYRPMTFDRDCTCFRYTGAVASL